METGEIFVFGLIEVNAHMAQNVSLNIDVVSVISMDMVHTIAGKQVLIGMKIRTGTDVKIEIEIEGGTMTTMEKGEEGL